MVEVEDVSYRDAAEALGIRLENLKMVIFRGRRKIFRGLARSLGDLSLTPAARTWKPNLPGKVSSRGEEPSRGDGPRCRIFCRSPEAVPIASDQRTADV